ncbi:MAG: hypothetical protein VX951_07100 [Planctomycetota bacterium]|nr:hypothetical protein [Planctomycetota bacterium]
MNEWLWIIPLAYFLISAIGGAASKKAKEVAQTSRADKQRTTLKPVGEVDVSADPAPADPVPAPSPRRKTADDIAAEIRRMMGLPPDPSGRPAGDLAAVEDRVEPVVIEEEPTVQAAQRSHGGDLHERLLAREAEGRRSFGTLETRHLEEHHSALVERHIVPNVGRSRRRGAGRSTADPLHRRSYVDLRNMARAFVTAEVLGPPKALREKEW